MLCLKTNVRLLWRTFKVFQKTNWIEQNSFRAFRLLIKPSHMEKRNNAKIAHKTYNMCVNVIALLLSWLLLDVIYDYLYNGIAIGGPLKIRNNTYRWIAWVGERDSRVNLHNFVNVFWTNRNFISLQLQVKNKLMTDRCPKHAAPPTSGRVNYKGKTPSELVKEDTKLV